MRTRIFKTPDAEMGRSPGFLAALLALLFVLLMAVPAQAETVTVHGFIFDSEAGLTLEADNGALYLLKGKDASAYLDGTATVTGEVQGQADGMYTLNVTDLAPDDEAGFMGSGDGDRETDPKGNPL